MPSTPKEYKPPLIEKNWKPNIELKEGTEWQKEQQFLKKLKDCFAFVLMDLESFKGQEVWIDLMDDTSIFCTPYTYSEAEMELIKACTKQLLDAELEFF